MKTTLLTLCMFASIVTFAQTADEEAEAIATLLGIQKKEAIQQLVDVSGKDSVAFWKVYAEYQKATKSNNAARIRLYERTARAYDKMTPARADSLALKYFTNRGEHELTLEQYYKKMKVATSAVVAFEFYQAEIYLLTTLRAQIMMQIPTYGAMQKAIKQQNPR